MNKIRKIVASLSILTCGVVLAFFSIGKSYATVPGNNTLVNFNSTNTQGSNYSDTGGIPSISKNGRYVAFTSKASDIVSDDTNNRVDVFVRDMQSNTTQRNE